jgi:hydrogenase maturation protease
LNAPIPDTDVPEVGVSTIVIGLGNPILGDDGVGIRIIRSLKEFPETPPSIIIQEASVGGLALVEMMVGYERAIVVDAIRSPDTVPGGVYRLTIDDLREMGPVQPAASPHDASLATAWDALRAVGIPLPDEVIVFGVGAEEVDIFSTKLTPAVEAAVPGIRDQILSELGLTA